MASITAIILTYNEEIHIERCNRSIKPVVSKIFVVDSFSTDKTLSIARALDAEVFQHPFKNQADQFQWAIDHCETDTSWLMRMDADEYLEPSLVKEIQDRLPNLPEEISGIYLKRKVYFQDQWIRHGGFYPHTLLRLWRTKMGRIEQRWMDEHIVLPPSAKTIVFNEHLVDDNHKGITFWTEKHNKYASREMADILINKYKLLSEDNALRYMSADPQARRKRNIKNSFYLNLPLGLRAAMYFFYRYFFKLGFLDGAKGFTWHFLQGFWYRLLVDVKVLEVEQKSQGNPQKISEILSKEYGIQI